MKKLVYLILLFLFSIIIIKTFILDFYYISSESMKNSLLVGDYIVCNKAAYRIKTPDNIPFTDITIPSFTLLDLKKPKRNDIINFKLNEFLVNENYYYKDLIKRIVGLPRETIFLSNNKIIINGKEIDNFLYYENNYTVNESYDVLNYPGENFSYLKYGPLKIPASGDTIEINPKNIKFWQPIINYESKGKFINNEGSVITFKGKPINQYIIKENYYFVLGDNIKKSVDSRILGFIPETEIDSKVLTIYLSIEPNSDNSFFGFFQRIRYNRILKTFY